LKEYEEKQKALQAEREAEERRHLEQQQQQQLEFEQRQREQAERERLAQEQLRQQQEMMMYSNQAALQAQELERELLAMRGQYERDQLLLEQYDRVGIAFFVISFVTVLTLPYNSESRHSKGNSAVSALISIHRWHRRTT
jgi:hypothetical protein